MLRSSNRRCFPSNGENPVRLTNFFFFFSIYNRNNWLNFSQSIKHTRILSSSIFLLFFFFTFQLLTLSFFLSFSLFFRFSFSLSRLKKHIYRFKVGLKQSRKKKTKKKKEGGIKEKKKKMLTCQSSELNKIMH